MDSESFFKKYFVEKEFIDRKEKSDEEPVDVIIPMVNSNILFEKNLYSFYREIPINRLFIGDNNIKDDSLEILKKFPRVEIINQQNYTSLGYCIAQLISKVTTKWFIYLHADVLLPESWFDIMKAYKHKYDWFECDRKFIAMIEYYLPHIKYMERAYSGSQMGQKKAFEKIITKIEDDYLYRNEDIVFQELLLKNGFKYGRVFDTFHYHQIADTRRNTENTFKNVIIQRYPDKEYDIKTYTMQAKGIIKYLPPKPYLIEAVNKPLKILQDYKALNVREFKKWVLSTNKQWLKHLFFTKKKPLLVKIIKKLQNLIMPLLNIIFQKIDAKDMFQNSVKGETNGNNKKFEKNNSDKKILDVGCGTSKIPGAIGIDIVKLPGVDVVQDLNKFPWGNFEDESFDEIYMNDILEHLKDTIKVMQECYRLLRFGGKLNIRVVYWNHKYSFSDPTHIHAFSEISFKFFTGELRPYYMDFKFRDLKIDYIFDPKAIRKFGNNKKKLLKKAYFNCNIIQGLKVTLTK